MILAKGLVYTVLALIIGLALIELYFVLLRMYYALQERTNKPWRHNGYK